MIDRLVQYAKHKHLVTTPGYAPKTVKWLIWLDSQGKLKDVVELGNAGQPRNPGREFPRCPDLQQNELIAGGITRSHFLVDTCDVVALLGAQADKRKQDKHDYFVGLLKQASADMPECQTAATALDDQSTLDKIRQRLEQLRAKPTDKVTLRVDNVTLVDDSRWHRWWDKYRQSLQGAGAGTASQMVCFATGQPNEPTPTHPKISGLADVGGQSSGSVLVGFDKDAFTSFGLEQSANCAVSQEATYAYRAALNELIARSSHRLVNQKVLHWYSADVATADDPIALLLGEDREQQEASAQVQVQRLMQSLHRGERPNLLESRYYVLTVAGSGGRVMVRDWMEGDFEELVANINNWFDQFTIVHREGDRLADPPKFMAVLGALVRDIKDVPAPTATRLFRCALTGEGIPYDAMAQALTRVKVDIVQDQPFNHARMGLLKAYHVRKGGTDMEARLNPNHPSPAYHCGRLMAVLANLQRAALGDVGAGVVQRFYAAASATPALILGRIVRTSQFHIDKVRADSPGLAVWYENQIAEIMAAIGDAIPRTLTLEEQSLFALGYYQQLAHSRTRQNRQEEEQTQ